MDQPARTWKLCGNPLPPTKGKGRPRLYCSDHCRNLAYEERLDERYDPEPAEPPQAVPGSILDQWVTEGTLVATPSLPDPEVIPSLMAASDVLGTGWFAAVAAEAGPGKTVAVVGDGAVGLLGILAAQQLGAERIIAFSRHKDRQALARDFGATDIVEERGHDGVSKVKDLTGGLGAHSVIEAVGTQEAMMQAIHSTRPGGHVGFVGGSHDVAIPGDELFMAGVHIHGGPAPVRRFLPELVQLIWDRTIDPGKVFDLTLPLEKAAEGYQAMDERTATKVLLTL